MLKSSQCPVNEYGREIERESGQQGMKQCARDSIDVPLSLLYRLRLSVLSLLCAHCLYYRRVGEIRR